VLREELRRLSTRHTKDLYRTRYTLCVVLVETRGCFRVPSRKFGILVVGRECTHLSTHVFRGSRHISQTMQEHCEIHPRAPHQDREPPAPTHIFQSSQGVRSELGNVHRFVRLEYVEQMVWHAALLCVGKFSRPDVEPAIHLYRVNVEDLPRETPREIHAERTLA
jgi:hypothetical protein